MNKRFALLLLFPFILAACGGGLSTDDAEKGIEAVFAGNRDEAAKYICEESLPSEEEMSEIPEGFSADASCEEDGDQMKCSVAMSFTLEEGGEPQTTTQEVTADVQDGKLCGGDLEN